MWPQILSWHKLNPTQRREVTSRPPVSAAVKEQISTIVQQVAGGDLQTLCDLCQQFDHWQPQGIADLQVTSSAIEQSAAQLDPELRKAIDRAYRNIAGFHQEQGLKSYSKKISFGISCERQVAAIERVGLYIPGGSSPLFSSVLMLGIPAKIAGVPQLVLCSPRVGGQPLNPALLYAAKLCGIEEIYGLGGAQAIAALAWGCDPIKAVNKICGPGNNYVNGAKKLLAQLRPEVAIDLPAGPSELVIVADSSAPPDWIAADLLAQAEHDSAAQVMLLSADQQLLVAVQQQLAVQLPALPRQEIARSSLQNSRFIHVDRLENSAEIINLYGPEHLSLMVGDSGQESLLPLLANAGSIFLGYQSPEALGDYLSGSNHVLPTQGCCHSYSGITVESFQRSFTVQKASRAGLLDVSAAAMAMARAEGLEGHARSVAIRL